MNDISSTSPIFQRASSLLLVMQTKYSMTSPLLWEKLLVYTHTHTHTHTHTNELQPEGLPSKFIQYSVASLKITHTLTTCKKQVVEMYYAI